MESILKKIMDKYPNYSISEKQIADYVVKHPEEIVQISIHALAKKLNISASTIMNFIKKTGLEGFSELKIKLAKESFNPMRQISWEDLIIQTNEDIIGTYKKVADTNINALSESLNIIRGEDILEAAKMIAKASRICIFGTGSSALLADETYDVLFRLGINCYHSPERDHQFFMASCMKEDEVAIIVSQTGVNIDNLKITSLLMERNIKTIGISNFEGTPFGRMVNILLAPLGGNGNNFNSDFTFRIPIFCVIETLYYTLLNLLGEPARKTAIAFREKIQTTTL